MPLTSPSRHGRYGIGLGAETGLDSMLGAALSGPCPGLTAYLEHLIDRHLVVPTQGEGQ